MTSFSSELKAFVDLDEWIFAKTYAETWPHEYLVRDKVDQTLFMMLVHHIADHGYWGHFYRREIRYLDQDGYVYWTMYRKETDPPHPDSYPLDAETIINRCKKKDSYEYKRDNGLLPDSEGGMNEPT